LFRGQGCDACGHTGFSGRIAAAELFSSDPALEDLILGKANIAALQAHLKSRGMRTLLEDGLEKAALGITTAGEVEREIMLSAEGGGNSANEKNI
jgi:type II secretory ATPase GspE/PulE/Tfp pilus assembly ATPase PilB-like protein